MNKVISLWVRLRMNKVISLWVRTGIPIHWGIKGKIDDITLWILLTKNYYWRVNVRLKQKCQLKSFKCHIKTVHKKDGKKLWVFFLIIPPTRKIFYDSSLLIFQVLKILSDVLHFHETERPSRESCKWFPLVVHNWNDQKENKAGKNITL